MFVCILDYLGVDYSIQHEINMFFEDWMFLSYGGKPILIVCVCVCVF